MKILILIPSITSYYTFLNEVTQQLLNHKFEVHLATSPKHLENIDCYDEEINGTYHPITFPRAFNPFQHIISAIKLRRLVYKIQPDIIHAHFFSTIFAMSLAKVCPYPITIATFHGLNSPLSHGWRKKVFQLLERYCISKVKSTWLLNKEDAPHIKKLNDNINIHTSLGIGCPISKFDPAQFSDPHRKNLKQKLGISAHEFIFIFIGRQVAHKGFATTVKAFIKLNARNRNCKLLLVGVKDNIHPTGLSKNEEKEVLLHNDIIGVGWQKDVQPYLSISDVLVFPSRREGVPVCLMEALAMGVPAITLNSRGCRDVVRDGIDGLIIDEDSPNGVFKAMKRLLDNPNELQSFSFRANLDSDRFDRKHYVNEQLEIYKNLAQSDILA